MKPTFLLLRTARGARTFSNLGPYGGKTNKKYEVVTTVTTILSIQNLVRTWSGYPMLLNLGNVLMLSFRCPSFRQVQIIFPQMKFWTALLKNPLYIASPGGWPGDIGSKVPALQCNALQLYTDYWCKWELHISSLLPLRNQLHKTNMRRKQATKIGCSWMQGSIQAVCMQRQQNSNLD